MQLKNISTYICILAISLFFSERAEAQKRKVPTVIEADTVPFFCGIAISADAAGAIQRWVSDYGQYEAALRVNLKGRYFPIIELGIGTASHEDDVTGIHYESSAPYGRIGCDFNVMKNKHDDYRIYVGARYAFTSFKYDLSAPGVADPVWGGEAFYGGKDISCSYHWAEGLAGVDAKIAGPIRLGWSVRYRSRISQKYGETGKPWYVPGFGKSGSSRLGATFNIIFEL